MRPLLVIVTLSSILALEVAGADSLWSPDFKGYLSGSKGLAKGDTVVVSVDASSSLSFSASNNDSKNLTIVFSGGEGGNLFSFLPQVKTGATLTTKGAEQYSLRGLVPAVVTDVDQTGRAMVQGSRSVTLEGKEESIAITGWVNPQDVDQKGQVSIARLGEARLVFKTLLAPSQPFLSDKDIQEIISAAVTPAAGMAAQPTAAGTAAPATAAPAAPATAATAGAAPTAATPAAITGQALGAPAAAAVTPQQAPTRTLSITDTRKKELLLLYLNRLIDVLFAQ